MNTLALLISILNFSLSFNELNMLSDFLDEIEERLRLIIREEVRMALLEEKNPPAKIEYVVKPELERREVNQSIPTLLTAHDVAEILSVSVQRVYELARSRKANGMPVVVLGERQYRFSKEAILEWINRDKQ